MSQKLDPRLLEVFERATAPADRHATLDVLVALDGPLTPYLREDLARRGLAVRTEAGTVLTGSVAVAAVAQVADSPHIVKIELGAPLYPEPGAGGGEGPIE